MTVWHRVTSAENDAYYSMKNVTKDKDDNIADTPLTVDAYFCWAVNALQALAISVADFDSTLFGRSMLKTTLTKRSRVKYALHISWIHPAQASSFLV